MTAARKRLPWPWRTIYPPGALARGPLEVAEVDPSLEKALAWLAGQRPAMEALLRRLVARTPSPRNAAGVNAVASAVAGELDASGSRWSGSRAARFGPHLAFAARPPAPHLPRRPHRHRLPARHLRGLPGRGRAGARPGRLRHEGRAGGGALRPAGARQAGLLDRVPLRGLLVGDEEVGSPDSRRSPREGARRGRGARPRVGARRRPPGHPAQGDGRARGAGPRRGGPRRQRAREGAERHLGAGPLRRPGAAAHRLRRAA